MKQQGKRIVYLTVGALVLIALTAWLALSTRIIEGIRNRDVVYYEIDPIEKAEMGQLYWQMDSIDQLDTMYDTMTFMGAAYNFSEATDEESTRSMLLLSENKNYRIELQETFHKYYLFVTDRDITRKLYSGFVLDFCPLGIKDGQYQIILQIEENGLPVARANTGYIIDKVHNHAALLYRPSSEIGGIADTRGWAGSGINNYETSLDINGTLNLSGWGFIDNDNIDTYETEVIVGISSGDEDMRFFSTTKQTISYIAEYFQNDLYYGAGFIASIPGVSEDNLKIYVFVKYGDVIYRCSYHFEPDGEGEYVSVFDE